MTAVSVSVSIRRAREARGWTQAMLAERVGTSQAYVARLEAGHIQPRVDTLERLAAALGYTFAVIISPPTPTGEALER